MVMKYDTAIPIATMLAVSLISSKVQLTFGQLHLKGSYLSFNFEGFAEFDTEVFFGILRLPCPFDFLDFRFFQRFRCQLLDSLPLIDSVVADEGSLNNAGDFVSLHVFDSYQDDVDGELELAARLEDLDSTVTG